MMLMRNPACKATQSTCLPSYSRKYAVTRSRQCAPGRQRVGTVASAVGTTPTATTYEDVWRGFAESAQGEWEGVTVTFDASGSAQQLPDRYVPSAYRDWGVELFDWQSQCSSVVEQAEAVGGSSRKLRNILKRLMPTVGCEADAIAFVEESQDVWQADGGSEVKPVTPCGSYVAAPASLPTDGGKVKVEVCLAAHGGSGSAAGGGEAPRRERLRVVVTLMQHWESKQWQPAFVDVSREAYDGPFNGGVELSGCAGGGKPFAKDPVVAEEQLAGDWRAEPGATCWVYVAEGRSLELQHGPAAPDRLSLAASAGTRMALPAGVWISCEAYGQDLRLEVGAVRGEAQRDVATCSYSQGQLRSVVLGREARV